MCPPRLLSAFLLAASIGVCHAQNAGPEFEPPRRLKTVDDFLAKGVLYPSPRMHDIDGDGQVELVIGDLRGQLLFAEPAGKPGSLEWGELQPVTTVEGEPIEFDNW